MTIVEISPVELAFCSGASSFLQSDFWGSFKTRFGWKALAFAVKWETGTEKSLLVLYRRLGPGIGFAYVPWGPELPPDYDETAGGAAAAELAAALRPFLPKDTAFIRFDFPWFMEGLNLKPFTRAAADVQPPDTVLVDLVPGEAAILGSMKSKWRYNIGLAEKTGVTVIQANPAAVPADAEIAAGSASGAMAAFYRLYKETAVRDGISIHNIEYYHALFEEAAKYGISVRLYLASHEGEEIAGIVTLFREREAVYLYGASSNHKRNLMAPYALQWQAMRDAKAADCHYYDMFGIPPRPPEEAPDHPMSGLYRFKTGFIGEGAGGRIVHRPGSWDYRYRPLVTALYSAAEKTQKKIWDIKKKLKKQRKN
jgi:lipid II:glycine glycyltransferase (peptidoglycan interpeptide bridge formation enzyme)